MVIAVSDGDSSPSGSQQKEHVTPLPKLQLAIILFLKLSEPVAATVIYPFIYQVIPNMAFMCFI